MWQRIRAILRKEFIHIRRDPRSLAVVFILPFVMMFILGYAIDMDLKNIRLGVLDLSHSAESRQLVDRINANGRFEVTARLEGREDIKRGFRDQLYRAVIVIPDDFTRQLATAPETKIQLVIDGSDAYSATVVGQYLDAFLMDETRRFWASGQRLPLQVRSLVLYNPEFISAHFVVPGLIAVILMMICALLTSVTVAREKETGTLEQMLVSPVRTREIIIGKFAPYIVMGFINAAMVLAIGHFWFGVPLRGRLDELALFTLVYIFAALALGLLISTRAQTQQVALMNSLMATMMPATMLSGFIFPIASMPWVLQQVTRIIPARYFIRILRGVTLKGAGFTELWPSAAALLAIGLVWTLIAMKKFSDKIG